MKIRFITTSGSPFDGAYLEKEMSCAPNLGDFVEFTKAEAAFLDREDVGVALLLVLERCISEDVLEYESKVMRGLQYGD